MHIYSSQAKIATPADLKTAARDRGYLTEYPDAFWSALLTYIKGDAPEGTLCVLDVSSLMDTVDSIEAADLIHGAWCVPLREAVHDLAIADDAYDMLESCPPDDAPAEWWLDHLAGENMSALAELMADVLTSDGKAVIYTDYDIGAVYYIN